MKTLAQNVSKWILALLLPVLGLLFPELADQEVVVEMLSNFGGIAVFTVIVTEGVKKLTGYTAGEDWKMWPFIYSWIVGAASGVTFWALSFGAMAIATVWWHAALMGILIALSANGLYTIPVVRTIIKTLFGYDDPGQEPVIQ
jgi:hypothetical protein